VDHRLDGPLPWDGTSWSPARLPAGVSVIHALPGETAFAAGGHASLLIKP
jgi:hypothetical protein